MSIDDVKDDSLFTAIIMLIPAVIREFFKRDGDTPSVKPRKEKKAWFAWLSPEQGAGVSHNPS